MASSEEAGVSEDLTSGARFNNHKLRMSLISPWAAEGLAAVLTFGAAKYTRYGECTCAVKNAEPTEPHASCEEPKRDELAAGTATNESSGGSTLSSANDSEKTPAAGTNDPRRKLTGKTTPESATETLPPGATASPAPSSMTSLAVDVPSVVEPTACASTTTTKPGKSEVVSASRATLGSDGSNKKSGPSEHAPTCGIHRVVARGEHNWARGLSFMQTIDSLERHLTAIKRGEDIDPESKLAHIDHVQANAMFLSHFMKLHRYKKFDDRWKETE